MDLKEWKKLKEEVITKCSLHDELRYRESYFDYLIVKNEVCGIWILCIALFFFTIGLLHEGSLLINLCCIGLIILRVIDLINYKKSIDEEVKKIHNILLRLKDEQDKNKVDKNELQ